MFDLHLHSYYSDGTLAPADLVKAASGKGLSGIALADHHGLWGTNEAAQTATQLGLDYLEGIEISVRDINDELHLLGYSHRFNRTIIERGLSRTRRGYQDRLRQVARCCRQLGYNQVSWAEAVKHRSSLLNSVVVWSDLTRQLQAKHQLNFAQARQLVTAGGACYVPYGDWVLSPAEAIDLLHRSNGVAILAHPGYLVRDSGLKRLVTLIDRLRWDGLDGLEISFPGNFPKLQKFLSRLSRHHRLLVTGGSDWHGAGQYAESDETFGQIGINDDQYQALLDRLD